MADEVLSVIIPIKDEAPTLMELVDSVTEAEVPGMEKELILVDDGSTDETPRLLQGLEGRQGFVVLRHETNMGKGAAIRTGLKKASGSIVLVQDADLEYDPAEIASLVEPIRRGETRVSYGSRFKGTVQGMALPNLIANKILAGLATLLGESRITDEATCYKAFDASLIKSLPLRCTGFEFCPEVTGLLLATRERIVEVPINYRSRSKKAGKKVRARDFFIAIVWLIWSRFGRKDAHVTGNL